MRDISFDAFPADNARMRKLDRPRADWNIAASSVVEIASTREVSIANRNTAALFLSAMNRLIASPLAIMGFIGDGSARETRFAITGPPDVAWLCLSASENYGFQRFNLIQKFRIAGTISLPRYPRNIMS